MKRHLLYVFFSSLIAVSWFGMTFSQNVLVVCSGVIGYLVGVLKIGNIYRKKG